MRKPFLLFSFIIICKGINGFTVTDTSLLKYYNDYKVNINYLNFDDLLEIPYVDSTLAKKIIESREKWKSIRDYKMLAYIIGKPEEDLISSYVIFSRPNLGFRVKTDVSDYGDRINLLSSVSYKKGAFYSHLHYTRNCNSIIFFSRYTRGAYRLFIGNYSILSNLISWNGSPIRILMNDNEKRRGISLWKNYGDYFFLLSGKYAYSKKREEYDYSHSKLEFINGYKLKRNVIIMGGYDSLIYCDNKYYNNFKYLLLLKGIYKGTIHTVDVRTDNNEIKFKYQGYFRKGKLEFSNKTNCIYSRERACWSTVNYEGKLKKERLEFRYYMKTRYIGEFNYSYYKYMINRSNFYKNIKLKQGIYTIFREDDDTSRCLYANLLTGADLPNIETGFFLNLLIPTEITLGVKGVVFTCYFQYTFIPDLEMRISGFIYNVKNNYRFENVYSRLYGTGNLYGRGTILKGGIIYSKSGFSGNFIFFLKQEYKLEKRIKLSLSYAF